MNFTQIGGADIADRPSSTRTFFLSLSRDSSQSTLFMGMAVDPYKVHRIAAVSTMPFKIMSRSPKVAQAAAAVAMSIPFQHSFRQTDRQSERPTDRATDCIRICSRKARPFGGGRVVGPSVGRSVKTITIFLLEVSNATRRRARLISFSRFP